MTSSSTSAAPPFLQATAASFSLAPPGALRREGNDRASGDFVSLLRAQGIQPTLSGDISAGLPNSQVTASGLPGFVQTQATTILAFKFADGVLVAGDRRATAGNTIVYEHADKVLEIDRHSVMAIAGVPATAWEMARVLEHSFQYYRRTQLQEMSVGGKVRALSKLLRDNFGLVMQGVGAVVPIFATYDASAVGRSQNGEPGADREGGKLYFYDVMGANFEVADFAATGSGSPAVRGILYYENSWGKKPLLEFSRDEALALALKALDTAADADSATGGVDRNGRIFPMMKVITSAGIETIPAETLSRLFREHGRTASGGLAAGSAGNA